MSDRDTRLDAAKGVLIALVVLGHFLPPSAGTDVDGVYSGWFHEPQHVLIVAIYLVHMPLFIVLSGAMARDDRVLERALRFLVLLLALQAFYLVALTVLTGEVPEHPTQPFFVLWYLLAMVWWTALVPLVRRHPRGAVAGSVLAAVVVGVLPFDGDVATYSRTLVFLPFFVVGHLHGRRLLAATAHPTAAERGTAAVVGALVVALTWLVMDDKDWLHGNVSFAEMGISDVRGLGTRAAVLAASALMCVVLLVLLPRTGRGWAALGRRSLPVFVLHPLFVLPSLDVLQSLGTEHDPWLTALLCVVLTIVTVAATSLPVLDRALRAVSTTGARGAVRALGRV
jgi:fucose 4-O-acetylase-like acetyltransferase